MKKVFKQHLDRSGILIARMHKVLPFETWSDIASHGSFRDMCCLARANRALQSIAEARLYREVSLNSSITRAMWSTMEEEDRQSPIPPECSPSKSQLAALSSSPRRSSSVLTFRLYAPVPALLETLQLRSSGLALLPSLVNLKALHVILDYDHSDGALLKETLRHVVCH